MFLEEQGYEVEKNTLFQDNQSAIKMEINGRNSCTGNSRHINIKYFWVKDRVTQEKIEVKYCPTYLMLADYFTKPLQGKLFTRFRRVIMGYDSIDNILMDPVFPLKERVEKCLNGVIRNTKSTTVNNNGRRSYADALRSKPSAVTWKEENSNGDLMR